MMTIRPSHERGGGDYGWLKTRHTLASAITTIPSGWVSVRCA
jgi:hypothetical protein